MIKYGRERLKECLPELQRVVERASDIYEEDITIKCGYRGQGDQETAIASGASHAHFGQSPHNFHPALGVDVVPAETEYSDEDKLLLVAQAMLEAADELQINITWGGVFPGSYGFKHPGDLPHFQLTDWIKMRG